MIKMSNVNKQFGRVKALENFSLHVPPGKVFGLIGPNGAGKTTAMSILATLLLPDSGSAAIDGKDVVQETAEVRGLFGYMPDFFGVYDGLRAAEYLEFFASAYHIPTAQRPSLARSLLELVNLGDKAEEYVDSLSRGMKQRLALARCLVHNPKVLILDEPASGLDPRARAEMKEIIKQLKQMGKTVLISSHILPELAEMCDEVAIMEQGRLLACGTVSEITAAEMGSRSLKIVVIDRARELNDFLNGRTEVTDTVPDKTGVEFIFHGQQTAQAELLRDIVSGGWQVVEFSEIKRNLEQAFMSVTREVSANGQN